MSLCLKNATFIDWESLEFSRTDIIVEEGSTGGLHFQPPGSGIADGHNLIDCNGLFVTKAFANGHHHIYSAFAKGMPGPGKKPTNFVDILEQIWWKLDKSLDLEMIKISALHTAIECAKNGVTFVIDHHSSPNAIEGSLETIAQAFDEVGISHLLCYEISDRDGTAKTHQALEETDNFLDARQGLIGLHASFTVGDKTFEKAVHLAAKHNTGIHIHVAEDVSDQKQCVKTYRKNVIERIASFGGLNNPKSVLVHCLHLSDNEREIIRNSPAWVAQNTESNLNNRVGFFNSTGLGENIMLGTDGMHSDMLRSLKASYFTGLNFDNTDEGSIYYRFRSINRYLLQNNFTGNEDNNLVVFDYKPRTSFHQENFTGNLIYGIDSKHIVHVISGGKMILKDRRITTADEDIINQESIKLSCKLWDKMGNY